MCAARGSCGVNLESSSATGSPHRCVLMMSTVCSIDTSAFCMRKGLKAAGLFIIRLSVVVFFFSEEISRFADKLQPIKELREMERLLQAPICLQRSRLWQAKWIHALISLAFILMARHIRAPPEARAGKYYAKRRPAVKKLETSFKLTRGINKIASVRRAYYLLFSAAAVWD